MAETLKTSPPVPIHVASCEGIPARSSDRPIGLVKSPPSMTGIRSAHGRLRTRKMIRHRGVTINGRGA